MSKHPENEKQTLPVVLTGPESSREYFDELTKFVADTLGAEALAKFKVIMNVKLRWMMTVLLLFRH